MHGMNVHFSTCKTVSPTLPTAVLSSMSRKHATRDCGAVQQVHGDACVADAVTAYTLVWLLG